MNLGSVFALLFAGHQVGDYWSQTNTQAAAKGGDGWLARRACAAHVATLTLTQVAFLAGGTALSGERLAARRVAAGLAFNAVTHYVIDRRRPLRRLAGLLAFTGKPAFHDMGMPRDGHDDNPCLGTGAMALDQALHVACLAVTAGYIAGGGAR